MAIIRYRVDLSAVEREQLEELTKKGKHGARMLARARVLLKADEGMTDVAIAAAVNVAETTVFRVRQRFVEKGLEKTLKEEPRAKAKPKLDDKQCAHLIAIVCSEAPDGDCATLFL